MKLFDTKNLEKASIILSFAIFNDNNEKTKSKAIYALLYLLYSIKVFIWDNA